MGLQLSSIVLGLFTFGLTILEVKRYNNLITPFTVTAMKMNRVAILINVLLIDGAEHE